MHTARSRVDRYVAIVGDIVFLENCFTISSPVTLTCIAEVSNRERLRQFSIAGSYHSCCVLNSVDRVTSSSLAQQHVILRDAEGYGSLFGATRATTDSSWCAGL